MMHLASSLDWMMPFQSRNESSSRFTPGSCRALSTRRAGGLDADADTHLGEDLIERADGREEYNRVHYESQASSTHNLTPRLSKIHSPSSKNGIQLSTTHEKTHR